MYCLIYDPESDGYLEFRNPVALFQTDDIRQVADCLQQAIEARGYKVGFMTYEASPAFDEAFVTHGSGSLPLLAFAVFEEVGSIPRAKVSCNLEFEPWQPSVSREAYGAAIRTVKRHIAEGDTYQVNYTFKLRSRLIGDPGQMFLQLQNEVKAEYAAYIELESQAICSFSPELFLIRNQDKLISKPMKGTAPRGLTLVQDRQQCADLHHSEKNRAENIMIVDMIRNDMGRVANMGTVEVKNRFDVTKYPYVWQMTSTVAAQADVPLLRVFESLFPCASITGAPKIRTMDLIKRLEPGSRGIYTGTIGYLAPDGRARFSVAIRTLVVDRKTGSAEYGVGSGIVWDSDIESEYQECLMKSGFIKRREPDFQLIESMLWDKSQGFYLLENHLERLADSAEYFGFAWEPKAIRQRLSDFEQSAPIVRAKVRLLLDKEGRVEVDWGVLDDVQSDNLKVGLALEPVDSQNRFLYHKTTHRALYEQAMKSRPDCDDAILWNEREEITESCRANVVAEVGGELITPPVRCGLLAGTFRNHLIRKGRIREKTITIREIEQATRIYTINSVRKWMSSRLI